MTDFEMLSIGIFFCGIMTIFFVGIGVIIGDVKHYFSDKTITKTGQLYDNGADTIFRRRHCSRGSNNGCDKEVNDMTREDKVARIIALAKKLNIKIITKETKEYKKNDR